MTVERGGPTLRKRIRYDYAAAGLLVYVAVERWLGPGGFGLLLVLNLVGVLYSNALRTRGPFSRR